MITENQILFLKTVRGTGLKMSTLRQMGMTEGDFIYLKQQGCIMTGADHIVKLTAVGEDAIKQDAKKQATTEFAIPVSRKGYKTEPLDANVLRPNRIHEQRMAEFREIKSLVTGRRHKGEGDN